MTTDTGERGLERLICTAPVRAPCAADTASPDQLHERPGTYAAVCLCGTSEAYDGADRQGVGWRCLIQHATGSGACRWPTEWTILALATGPKQTARCLTGLYHRIAE
jgi:hypothetical protein